MARPTKNSSGTRKPSMETSDAGDLFASLEKKHGGDQEVFYSSGVIALDLAVSNGRGLPAGRMIELASPEGVGKSTLALNVCRHLCEQGADCVYIDSENGINDEQLRCFGLAPYARGRGEAGKGRFVACSVGSIQQADEIMMEIFARKQYPRLVVIDSIAMLFSDKIEEQVVGSSQPGVQARVQTEFLKKYKAAIRRHGVTVLLINQMRTKINFRGQTLVRPSGGAALGHIPDVKLELKRRKTLDRIVKTSSGAQKTKWAILSEIHQNKNRYMLPIPVPMLVIYGVGVSNSYNRFLFLESLGIAQSQGLTYTVTWEGQKNVLRGVTPMLSWIMSHREAVDEFIAANGGFQLVAPGESDGDIEEFVGTDSSADEDEE